MTQANLVEMSDKRRELLLKVFDNQPETLSILHLMTAYVRCDDALRWLIKNRITGKTFLEWVKLKWERRVHSMVQFILMKVDRERVVRPILAGRDYIIQ